MTTFPLFCVRRLPLMAQRRQWRNRSTAGYCGLLRFKKQRSVPARYDRASSVLRVGMYQRSPPSTSALCREAPFNDLVSPVTRQHSCWGLPQACCFQNTAFRLGLF